MPERIQLKRTKGWRMPDNTVKVDRSTKWGNPFKIGEAGGIWTKKVQNKRHAWQLFRSVAMSMPDEKVSEVKAELKGKNLACWCPLPTDPYQDDECHAAVLLELANE